MINTVDRDERVDLLFPFYGTINQMIENSESFTVLNNGVPLDDMEVRYGRTSSDYPFYSSSASNSKPIGMQAIIEEMDPRSIEKVPLLQKTVTLYHWVVEKAPNIEFRWYAKLTGEGIKGLGHRASATALIDDGIELGSVYASDEGSNLNEMFLVNIAGSPSDEITYRYEPLGYGNDIVIFQIQYRDKIDKLKS